jgi:hypothetical protein
MNGKVKRPWYRWHWLTWLVAVVVGGALTWSQVGVQINGVKAFSIYDSA